MSSTPLHRLRRILQRVRHSGGRTRTLPVLALAVLAVVLATVAVVGQPTASPQAASPAVTAAQLESADAPSDLTPVAVIGDSISAGTAYGGLGTANWTQLLGVQRHWMVTNAAIGGTGYVNPGTSIPFQAAQLEKVVAVRPKIVIVEGSRNDIGAPVAQITGAAAQLWRELATRLPGVKIIAVGPFWDRQKDGDSALPLLDAMRETAQDNDVEWIDTMREGWFAGAYDGGGLIGPDDVHPTDAGHVLYARRLGADLDRLGV